MKNAKYINQNGEIDSTVLVNKNEALRSNIYERYKQKNVAKFIDAIATQLMTIPSFVEQIMKQGEMVLDISQDMAEKLAKGTISFGTYQESGLKYAQFVNSDTGKIVKNIPIKELPTNLGPSIADLGLAMKLQQISDTLDVLGEKVDQVNRNFDLNRYAEVQSAKEKFEMAILAKDAETKKVLLRESMSQATNAKNLLLNQLLETKKHLITSKSKNKIPFITTGLSADAGDKLAQTALENLSYMKDAFYYQIATQYELGEYEMLNYTIDNFKAIILQNFSGNDALELDQYLSIATNPFKFLSNEVIESSESILKFIDKHEELLAE
ncbi:hypothetical protein, partial [Carnobacterium divergens]|uniref:Uncharacterized protein n=1 Tax=Carnobacterium divergens DSM 20623 TaxID=1449336 RepID=A0A0R2HVM4_CARDV